MESLVVSVNVGRPAPLASEKGTVLSGIVKAPVAGPVALTADGLEGDGQADLRVHGGPFRAVYVYSADDYAWWEGELGRPLPPGLFGENLTVTGLTDDTVRVGEHIRVGGAVIEANVPREPCRKLGLRMRDPRFPKRFLAAGRMGFYGRVVEEGPVAAGDPVTRVAHDPQALTVADVHRLYAHDHSDRDGLTRMTAAAALPEGWRSWALERLVGLGAA